jgi:hypothetical protein
MGKNMQGTQPQISNSTAQASRGTLFNARAQAAELPERIAQEGVEAGRDRRPARTPAQPRLFGGRPRRGRARGHGAAGARRQNNPTASTATADRFAPLAMSIQGEFGRFSQRSLPIVTMRATKQALEAVEF